MAPNDNNFSSTNCFSWLFRRGSGIQDPKSTVPGLTPRPTNGVREQILSGVPIATIRKPSNDPQRSLIANKDTWKSDVLSLGLSVETVDSSNETTVRNTFDFEALDTYVCKPDSPSKQTRQKPTTSDLEKFL